jgi:mannose-6-phosphate isomerase
MEGEVSMTKLAREIAVPFGLKPTFSERVWGRESLAPWYEELGTSKPVGEAWLTGPESVVTTGPDAGKVLAEVAGDFPLLVKMLFPSDKLSVQVHPDDDEAQALGQPRGKTECWYVLEAVQGAAVALGLKAGVTVEDLRAAGERTEELIEMVPVSAGDMVFVDAGTVHAIGPGVTLLEVQQTSDITYRLYDYGRPRELHLEQGLAVTKTETRAGKVAARAMDGFVRLIEERYFVVDRFEEAVGETVVPFAGVGCLVGLSGSGVVRTEAGDVPLVAGRAVVCPIGEVTVVGDGVGFVRCVAPE